MIGSALLLLGPLPAAARAHMTVEYTLELLVGPRGPEGLRVTWTIDRDVSEVLLDLFDTDRNGALSPAEVRRLEQHVRQEQGRSGFFTAITLDGVPLPTPAPQGFGVTVDQGRLKYHFVLPIQAKGVARGTVDVTVDDPTYFVAFALAPGKPVKVTAAAQFVAECPVGRRKPRTRSTSSGARTRDAAGRYPNACRNVPPTPKGPGRPARRTVTRCVVSGHQNGHHGR